MNENEKKKYETPHTEVTEVEYEGILCISGEWGLID